MKDKDGDLAIEVNHQEKRELDNKRFENRIVRQKRAESFWKILAVIAVISSLAGNALISATILQEIKKPQMVAILDESRDIVVTPLESLETSVEIEQYCSELCTTALLSRNWQVSYTYPAMIPRVFAPALQKELRNEGDAWKKDAEAARLNWSPIISKFTPHSNTDGSIIITRVEGILKESGVFGGVLEEKTSRFVLGLKLMKNPKIGERGRFPWVCVSYNLAIKDNSK